MKLVVDAAIPYARPYAEQLGRADFLPAAEITSAAVRDADALVVRTRTRCDAALLEGSRVRFIATATIGYDHLDTAYLHRRGIAWTNCPGCNAGSVEQYVHSALLRLALSGKVRLDVSTTLGIVGVGHVGSRVERMARKMGLSVLLCDPPRADRGESGFIPLEDVIRHADIITFHVPLTRTGRHATYHMADEPFFRLVAEASRHPVIVNTSRGEVVCTESLVRAFDEGVLRAVVVDTWEDEPRISPELLCRAFLATPHIAGYSADGKARATQMALAAVARHFGLDRDFAILPPDLPEGYEYRPYGFGLLPREAHHFLSYIPEDAMYAPLRLFDPLCDTLVLRAHPELFEAMRSHYPLRREFS
ncbi:MAG: 4-phosphoerythronate dehydrogenase [Alloprevotella sp.]|nr:4-phosphoerythronate dehydrogenase [Alloprevotella sp.]